MESTKAVGRYLIIEQLAEEDNTTESGVLLSANDINSQRHKRGKVLSVGQDVNDRLKVGDIVWYDKAGSFKLFLQGVQRTIIQEHTIAVVEDRGAISS